MSKASTKCDLSVIYAPKLVKPLFDLETAQKKTAIIEAEIDAFPTSKIEWFKNNQPIDCSSYELEGRYSVFDRKGGVYQLVIKNCKPSDTASYKIKASNKMGEITSEAKLSITSAPVFIKKMEQVDAVEGCEFKINVIASGYPMPAISIAKNNNDVDLNDSVKFKLIVEKIEAEFYYSIIVNNTSKSDVGTYQIALTNDAGRASCIGKVVLHPLTAPKFIVLLQNDKILPVNKEIVLQTKVSGIPVPKINWLKDEKSLNENSNFIVSYDEREGFHYLKSSRPADESLSGLYKVIATNPGGEVISVCNLVIKGREPHFINKPEKITCLEGSTAVLGCSFDGEPQPIATWTHKNKELKLNEKFSIDYEPISKSSILSIKNLSKQDEGTYIVTIKNIHGSENTPVSLLVTQNAEEVNDYRQFLKASETVKHEEAAEEINWGTLKEGKEILKDEEPEKEQIKLKKVELLPKFIREPRDLRVLREKEAKFEAEVKSSTKVDFKWFANENEIKSKEGIRLEKDTKRNIFTLLIRRVNSEFESEIKCIATNEHGTVEAKCNLIILGK